MRVLICLRFFLNGPVSGKEKALTEIERVLTSRQANKIHKHRQMNAGHTQAKQRKCSYSVYWYAIGVR